MKLKVLSEIHRTFVVKQEEKLYLTRKLRLKLNKKEKKTKKWKLYFRIQSDV